MALAVETLLVLKAYFLGRAIADGTGDKDRVNALIDAAILKMQKANQPNAKLRQLFYVLLKAEVLRGHAESISARELARELSGQLKSPAFDDYMAIEEATRARKKVGGISRGLIVDEGVRTHAEYYGGNKYGVFKIRKNVVFEALDINEKDLTDAEYRFLHQTPLAEILKKHGVESAP